MYIVSWGLHGVNDQMSHHDLEDILNIMVNLYKIFNDVQKSHDTQDKTKYSLLEKYLLSLLQCSSKLTIVCETLGLTYLSIEFCWGTKEGKDVKVPL